VNKKNLNKQEYSNLKGQICGLLSSLRQLAPHPEQKNAMAPLFLKSHAIFKPVSDHDTMLGGIAMEGLLAEAFDNAANDVSSIPTLCSEFDALGDLVSEYISESAPDTKGRGRGTIALGEHKVIANDFNMSGSDPAMMAFLKDLPKRRQIEESLASLVREMDTYDTVVPCSPEVLAA